MGDNTTEDFVDISYLLLYDQDNNSELFKIKSGGPMICTWEQLLNFDYPKSELDQATLKSNSLFFVYNLADNIEPEFSKYSWNITHLLSENEMRVKPKVVSLIDLINDSEILKMKI